MGALLLIVVILLVASPVLVLAVLTRARGPLPRQAGLPAATLIARFAGVAIGACAAAAVTGIDGLGRGELLAGPVFGGCVLAGVLIGELLAPRPAAARRVAGLETRLIRDYVPKGSTALALAETIVLVGLTVTAGVVGTVDDLGRGGRALHVVCGDVMRVATPWPGWFYGGPTLIAVVAGLLASLFVLRALARRPRPDHDSPYRRWDDLHRARGGQAVISGYGALVSLPLAGSAFFAAGAVNSAACESQDWTSTVTGLLVGTGFSAAGALAWFVSQLFATPKRARPMTVEAGAGPAEVA